MRRTRWIVAASAAVAVFAAACGGGGGSEPATEAAESPGDEQGRFDGVEVVFAGPAGQLDFIKEKADQWAEETGATVRVDEIPFGEINDKVISALRTDTFIADVINIGSNLGGDLMGGGLVQPVPDWAQEKVGWDDVLPVLREHQLSWDGVPHALPWDGDLLTYFYRTDLFDEHADEFESRYGRPLEPADTWQEYAEIAEFFTEIDWYDGTDGYGMVELPMRNNQGWNGFMTRAVSYAKAPDDPSVFFDTETMEPRINNPGFVRALEDWRDAVEFGPPDMLNFGWIENAQTFVGGLAAQDIQFGDIGPMSRGEESAVTDAVGYDLAPGASEYWDPSSESWVSGEEPNRAPFLGFGGWIHMVPSNAREPAAAFDLAAYLGSEEVLNEAVTTPGTGANPPRGSTLDPSLWAEAGWPEEEAAEYLGSIRDSLEHPNAVFDMRLPGFPEYRDAVELAVSLALSGQAEPQEALDEAAERWEQITDDFGREEQRERYLASLGASE